MIDLSEEQRLLVDEVKRLAENEFAEKAFSWEGEGYPDENIDLLADRGFLGINLSPEYGGGGMTEFDVALQIETVGRVCPDTAAAIYGQSMVAPRAIEMFGSEWAKDHYLPQVTDGEMSIAIAISEPEAGSDSQNMVTTVEEEDGELYLNGEKTWVSSVPESDAAVVWARFPGEGLGTVIMEFDQPGVEIHQHHTNMHGDTQTQFYMEDVHIPEERVLVRGPQALKEQLKALNWERCGSSMLANSISLNAFDKAVEYAQQREQFDQPIGDFQGIRWKIADMAKRVEGARALTYRAALSGGEDGAPDRLAASLAKLSTSETVERVVSEALQVHGANGYQQGHPLEYLYRLARGRRIAAGTDEIMKNNIADVVFEDGLPQTL
jgi:alkylation response protein AidB-like acyl-CoA dehydrogenase